MPELWLGSIPVSVLIVALIEVLKWAGLPSRFAPLANILLSAAAIILIGVVGIYPDLLQPVTTALNIVIAILTAAGFYDLAQNVTRSKSSA